MDLYELSGKDQSIDNRSINFDAVLLNWSYMVSNFGMARYPLVSRRSSNASRSGFEPTQGVQNGLTRGQYDSLPKSSAGAVGIVLMCAHFFSLWLWAGAFGIRTAHFDCFYLSDPLVV